MPGARRGDPGRVAVIDPADTALLVSRALRKGSALLAVSAVGVAACFGQVAEEAALVRGTAADTARAAGLQQAGLVLVIGLLAVLAAHVVAGRWARGRLADRMDREWAAAEARWSRPSPGS